ncbi:hypothetical protein RB595_010734 [Gaeumannomyces hyphopodioides]
MDRYSRSLRRRASQDTIFSMLELEPSPMDAENDPPELPEKDDASAASTRSRGVSTGSTTASLGLSGTGHGPVWYLTRVQRWSSYTFTIFASVHLATTSLVPLLTRSVAASESYLLLSREIYQTRLSEPLLVAVPLAAHVAAGLALRLVRRSQNLQRYGGATPAALLPQRHASAGKQHRHHHHHQPPRYSPWPTVSTTALAGYGACAAVLAHAGVNRVLPLLAEGDSADVGLAFVAHGFARHPAVSWAAYAALVGLTTGHAVWGWARWLGVGQAASWTGTVVSHSELVDGRVRKRRRRSWLLINTLAASAGLLWAAGGLGVVAKGGPTPGWVGDLYDGLFQRVYL